MRGQRFSIAPRWIFVILVVTLFVGIAYATIREAVLYTFSPDAPYGSAPIGGLVFDAAGNLYGTTERGGYYAQYGTVFELARTAGGGWKERTLHSFNPNIHRGGANPQASLIFDAVGNLYGTTTSGGAYGYGTAFELTANGHGGWSEITLHSFNKDGNDGYWPACNLIFDAAGNLYGTTTSGGTYDSGMVFELTPDRDGGWTEVVLHDFNHGTDGSYPQAGLTFDAAGNLYGTTVNGGTYGYGTVFALNPEAGGGWAETVLHSFNKNGTDGINPYAGLILDAAGNLFGTTIYGGSSYFCGTVFGLSPKAGGGWREGVLHSFTNNQKDGCQPYAGLISDGAGNLYGTTSVGGTQDCGTVFAFKPKAGQGSEEKVFYSFLNDFQDGCLPTDSVTMDALGNLYGTTASGGMGLAGTVFGVKP